MEFHIVTSSTSSNDNDPFELLDIPLSSKPSSKHKTSIPTKKSRCSPCVVKSSFTIFGFWLGVMSELASLAVFWLIQYADPRHARSWFHVWCGIQTIALLLVSITADRMAPSNPRFTGGLTVTASFNAVLGVYLGLFLTMKVLGMNVEQMGLFRCALVHMLVWWVFIALLECRGAFKNKNNQGGDDDDDDDDATDYEYDEGEEEELHVGLTV